MMMRPALLLLLASVALVSAQVRQLSGIFVAVRSGGSVSALMYAMSRYLKQMAAAGSKTQNSQNSKACATHQYRSNPSTSQHSSYTLDPPLSSMRYVQVVTRLLCIPWGLSGLLHFGPCPPCCSWAPVAATTPPHVVFTSSGLSRKAEPLPLNKWYLPFSSSPFISEVDPFRDNSSFSVKPVAFAGDTGQAALSACSHRSHNRCKDYGLPLQHTLQGICRQPEQGNSDSSTQRQGQRPLQ